MVFKMCNSLIWRYGLGPSLHQHVIACEGIDAAITTNAISVACTNMWLELWMNDLSSSVSMVLVIALFLGSRLTIFCILYLSRWCSTKLNQDFHILFIHKFYTLSLRYPYIHITLLSYYLVGYHLLWVLHYLLQGFFRIVQAIFSLFYFLLSTFLREMVKDLGR
jgi:hypothetical protein